jgi:putative flippase GtrA
VKNVRELVICGVGGALGTGIDVVVLLLLVKIGLPIPLAAFFAAANGACLCFLVNKYFAFRDRSPLRFEQMARFIVVALGSAILIAGFMKIFAVELAWPVVPSKLLSAAIVFLIWTYPVQRRVVFRTPQSPAASMA